VSTPAGLSLWKARASPTPSGPQRRCNAYSGVGRSRAASDAWVPGRRSAAGVRRNLRRLSSMSGRRSRPACNLVARAEVFRTANCGLVAEEAIRRYSQTTGPTRCGTSSLNLPPGTRTSQRGSSQPVKKREKVAGRVRAEALEMQCLAMGPDCPMTNHILTTPPSLSLP